MSYDEQLKDQRWQYVRARVLERDNWECKKCRSLKDLQVHHLRYEKGRKAWEYNDSDLLTLCDSCHKKTHIDDGSLYVDPLTKKLDEFVIVTQGWLAYMKSKFNG